MDRHYVYELIDPRDGLPFYVGKGIDGRAAWHSKAAERNKGSGDPYKDHIIQSIHRDGLDVVVRIVESLLTENAAYTIEAELTKSYGLRIEDPPGILTNLIHGGNGGQQNLKWTNERRASEARRMTGNTLARGRTQSEIEKDVRRQSLIRIYETEERVPSAKQLAALNQKGRKRSAATIQRISSYASNRTTEHRQNLSKALKGKEPSNKGIVGVIKESAETKEKKRLASLGKTPRNKGVCGVVKMSEESIERRIQSRRSSVLERGKW